jgi:hypothetical protein
MGELTQLEKLKLGFENLCLIARNERIISKSRIVGTTP